MINCKNCIHKGLCIHEDKVVEYIKQYESMREKCSLFDVDPTCNRFVDESIIKQNHESKRDINDIFDKFNEPKITLYKTSDELLDDLQKRGIIY